MCDRFLCQNFYICSKLLTFHSVNVCMMSYLSLALIRQIIRKQIRNKNAGVNMFMITVMFSGKTHAQLIQHQCFLLSGFSLFLVQIIKTDCIFLEEGLVSVCLLQLYPFLRLFLSLSPLLYEGLSLPLSFPGLQ